METQTTKRKRRFYIPSSFSIIFLLIIFFIILSWIFKAANIDTIKWVKGETETVQIKGLGLLDTLTSLWHGFVDKAQIILFILCLGGLLNVMARTKAIDAAISLLVKKLKGKEILLVPSLMIIFGLGGTTYGMWEETIAFFPILIPVFVKAGYGSFTAILTILLGAGVGVLASTVNPFATGAATEAINDVQKSFQASTMMGTRWLSWVLFMPLAIAFVTYVALQTKKGKYSLKGIDQQKIEAKFAKEDKFKFTLRRKITLTIFVLSFVLLILAYLPWSDWIGKTNLGNSTKNADKYFFWLATSSMWEDGWGGWYFISISGVFFAVALLVFAINHNDFISKDENKENTFISTFINGSKDVLTVSLIIATAAGLGIILDKSNIGLLIANSAKDMGNIGLIGFAVIIFILSIILSFFVPSTSGFATAFIPIFANIAVVSFTGANQTAALGLIILAFIFASGIVNLISPTSAALMGYTQYANIPFPFWIKKVWRFVAALTVMATLLIIIFAGIAQSGSIF